MSHLISLNKTRDEYGGWAMNGIAFDGPLFFSILGVSAVSICQRYSIEKKGLGKSMRSPGLLSRVVGNLCHRKEGKG